MNLNINNVTIELNNDIVTQIKKAIEEFEKSDEIQVGDMVWCMTIEENNDFNLIVQEVEVANERQLQYLVEGDYIVPCKNYTKEQAKEYFDKRDARRAAETKLRKIISDMNKKDGFVARFDGVQDNYHSYIDQKKGTLKYFSYSNHQHLEQWRYSSRETAQFINENHADLLKAYLNG